MSTTPRDTSAQSRESQPTERESRPSGRPTSVHVEVRDVPTQIRRDIATNLRAGRAYAVARKK